jgi:hypothetical protein
MSSYSTPNIAKHRPIHRTNQFFSSAKIKPKRINRINRNFLAILRKIAHPQQPNPTNQMISFLNLRRKKEQPSLQCIPSIENMLSEQNIQDSDGFSKSSI